MIIIISVLRQSLFLSTLKRGLDVTNDYVGFDFGFGLWPLIFRVECPVSKYLYQSICIKVSVSKNRYQSVCSYSDIMPTLSVTYILLFFYCFLYLYFLVFTAS